MKTFLAENTQDWFGLVKKYPMYTMKYAAVFFVLWALCLLEVLDILFRHMASWIVSNINR